MYNYTDVLDWYTTMNEGKKIFCIAYDFSSDTFQTIVYVMLIKFVLIFLNEVQLSDIL